MPAQPSYAVCGNVGSYSHCRKQTEVPAFAAAAAKSLSRVRLSATPLTAAHQAPPSLGFSRQEHWSGVPFPSLTEVPKKHKNRVTV